MESNIKFIIIMQVFPRELKETGLYKVFLHFGCAKNGTREKGSEEGDERFFVWPE